MTDAPSDESQQLALRIEQLWEAARSRLIAGRRREAAEALTLRRVLMTRLALLAAESRFRVASELQSEVAADLVEIEREVSRPLHGN